MKTLLRPFLALCVLSLILSPNALLARSATMSAPASAQIGEQERASRPVTRSVPIRRAAPIAAIAQFGPFRVVEANRAELIGVTDRNSPAQFTAMLKAFPGIQMLDLIDCPGTDDDTGNLAVGRLIRAHGIATHVPPKGSVRSGGVELFLAGQTRLIDDGAEFAVHSWRDSKGREPKDFSADAPENRSYTDYYQEMGMSASEAAAFYNMTNSVPNSSAKWLTAQEMRRWVANAEKDLQFVQVGTAERGDKTAYGYDAPKIIFTAHGLLDFASRLK